MQTITTVGLDSAKSVFQIHEGTSELLLAKLRKRGAVTGPVLSENHIRT